MKILLLCTYPINIPRHGGQIRVKNILEHYQRSGFQVEIVGVSGGESYPASKGFEPYPGDEVLAKIIDHPFLMEDVAIAGLYAKDTSYFNRLADKIKQTPDIIHVEQPWLFGFAKRLMKERFNKKHTGKPIKLIYGSQNIEYKLKQSILNNYLPKDQVEEKQQQVKLLEMQAIKQADGIICVSQNDLTWTQKHTAQPAVLAANGVNPWTTTDQGITLANQISGHKQYALFCASAHPPNIEGFFELFGNGFGSLSARQKLIIAGSAGDAIINDPRINQSARLAQQVISAGMVSNSCLSALLDMAHCIVVPITQGGGTNLKTAEAIWAGRHTIATTVAMRGFEAFIDSAGILVADKSDLFKQQLRQIMQTAPLKISPQERKKRKQVLWHHCLLPITTLIKQLANTSTGK